MDSTSRVSLTRRGSAVHTFRPARRTRRSAASRPEAAGMLPRAQELAHHLAQMSDRRAELLVAHVRRGAEPQHVAAVVGFHTARAQPHLELARLGAPEREKSA